MHHNDDPFRNNAWGAEDLDGLKAVGRAMQHSRSMFEALRPTEHDAILWEAGTPREGDSVPTLARRWVIRWMHLHPFTTGLIVAVMLGYLSYGMANYLWGTQVIWSVPRGASVVVTRGKPAQKPGVTPFVGEPQAQPEPAKKPYEPQGRLYPLSKKP
jgi:hypothetical protein